MLRHLATAPLPSNQLTRLSATVPNQLVRCTRAGSLRAKSTNKRVTTMASGIPLITMGKSQEVGQKIKAFLAPKYAVQSIHDDTNKLLAGLEAAPQKPRGLLIGGGFTDEEAEEGSRIIKDWDPTIKTVVRVTPGTLEKVGPAGVAGWIKEQLDAVDWS